MKPCPAASRTARAECCCAENTGLVSSRWSVCREQPFSMRIITRVLRGRDYRMIVRRFPQAGFLAQVLNLAVIHGLPEPAADQRRHIPGCLFHELCGGGLHGCQQ